MKGTRLKDVLDDTVLDHKFWNGIFAKMNQLLIKIENTNPSIDDVELRWVSDRIEYWNSEERILTNTDYFSDMDGQCQGVSLEGMLGTGRLNIYKALSAGVFPSLSINEVNYLNDTDQDGVFNPGETVKIKLVIANEEGWADAENVIATITTDDDRIFFTDSIITFSNDIPSGGSSFTLVDHFLAYAFEDAQLGDIPCVVEIQAGTEEPYYETEFEIDVSLSLNQYDNPT